MAPLTCSAFLRHSWLGPCSSRFLLSSQIRDYLLSHYFPELAPICRLSGLMGSDVKIYHNLQFARPLPPVMMPQPAALSLRMNEWAAPSGGEGGGCLPGAGGNLGHLVIRAGITQSWPRNKHRAQTKLCYTLKPWLQFRCSLRNVHHVLDAPPWSICACLSSWS